MNRLSTMGRIYLIFGFITCGCYCAAGFGRWMTPDFGIRSAFMSGGSGGHGSSYGRSSGGFWGGGK